MDTWLGCISRHRSNGVERHGPFPADARVSDPGEFLEVLRADDDGGGGGEDVLLGRKLLVMRLAWRFGLITMAFPKSAVLSD